MASEQHCRQLADRLREILQKGIRLDNDVMHYIDATHAMPSVEELTLLLTDPADAQDASLRELIFSPDEGIQRQVEELLLAHDFQKADEQKVVNCLLMRPVLTELFPPDRRFALALNMPRSSVDRFVRQLNIGTPMDHRLTTAVHRYVDRPLRAAVSVRLRNRRFKLTGDIVDFLGQMIEKLAPGLADFSDCFDFMLGLF